LFQKLEENFTHWQKAFARYDVLYGREIQVHEADGHYWYGVAQGVNEAGLLRVLHPEGERLCHAGEVSIRQHPERAGGQDAFIG
jgi:biotin-(acetyl-CoA carboxylase) ligase